VQDGSCHVAPKTAPATAPAPGVHRGRCARDARRGAPQRPVF